MADEKRVWTEYRELWLAVLATVTVLLTVLGMWWARRGAAVPKEPTVELRVGEEGTRGCFFMTLLVKNRHFRPIEVEVKVDRPDGMKFRLGTDGKTVERDSVVFAVEAGSSAAPPLAASAPHATTETIVLDVWWRERRPWWALRTGKRNCVTAEAALPR